MVAVFIYSKRYGDQGPPISNPKSTEHFSVSVPLGNGKFATRQAALSRMADMQIKYIRGNSFNFQSNNGLMGNGTAGNPLAVDVNWVESNFINSKYWHFSQIGDPTDTDLTISGSYLSVNYPYGVDHYGSTAFVEGNGDLRILKHVTNGEDFRVTYATWKNYRKSQIADMRITDTVYRPPGLASGEYIHNVFGMSSRAMLAEIWVGVDFKEYVFINLNGTAVAEYHTFVRLGNNPLTVFTGYAAYNDAFKKQCFRSMNVIATILGGRKFLVCITPPSVEGSLRLQTAEVFADGSMALVENFAVTNTLGFKTNDVSFQTIHNKLGSYDEADQDRCFYLSDPLVTINHVNTANSSSPTYRFTGQELPDEKLGILIGIYAASQYSVFTNQACKCQQFYVLDPINRKLDPSPGSGTNRGYRVDVHSNQRNIVVNGPWVMAGQDHYYALGLTFQFLSTGDRVMTRTTTWSNDIIPQITLYKSTANDIVQGMNDEYFVGQAAPVRSLVLDPPTPVQATRAGIIIRGNLVTTFTSNITSMEAAAGAWTKFVGSWEAREYKLLNSSGNTFTAIKGYNLSPTRGAVNFSLAVNTFRNPDGGIFYHNACWGRFGSADKVCDSSIDADAYGEMYTRGKYTFNVAIREKMNKAILDYFTTNPLDGHTEIHTMNWLLIPGHMSVNRNHAFYKILISFRTPDPSNPLGYRYSSTYMLGGVMAATINVNGDGDCRFVDVDTSMIRMDAGTIITGNVTIGGDDPRRMLNTAILYKVNSNIDIILGGGFGSANSAGNPNHDGWLPHGIKTNTRNFDPVVIRLSAGLLDKVSVHQTLGLGFVTTSYGMGAVYVFRAVDEDTLQPTTARGGPWVLGSARPAAGFNLTVSAPVEIYNQGLTHILPVQTYDLTKIQPTSATAHKNAHLYMYAILNNGAATLKITYDPLPEHNAQIFLGHIKTSDTEITSIIAKTTSRWEIARPSTDPIGGALPVATGIPSSLGVDSIWENHELRSDSASEYLWGENDLYDTDGNYETVVIDSYWSTKADGSDVVSNSELGDDLYYIVKTLGPANSIQLKINAPTFTGSMFEVGEVEKWINIGLTKTGNIGFGSYLIRTLDEDEMSFRNTKYQNLTPSRAFNTEYSNDTNSSIVVSIVVQILDGVTNVNTNLTVEGEVVSSGFVNGDVGTRMVTTLVAVVSPGEKYKLIPGSGVTIVKWSERRPI